MVRARRAGLLVELRGIGSRAPGYISDPRTAAGMFAPAWPETRCSQGRPCESTRWRTSWTVLWGFLLPGRDGVLHFKRRIEADNGYWLRRWSGIR